jgi:hypothetical protein
MTFDLIAGVLLIFSYVRESFTNILTILASVRTIFGDVIFTHVTSLQVFSH